MQEITTLLYQGDYFSLKLLLQVAILPSLINKASCFSCAIVLLLLQFYSGFIFFCYICITGLTCSESYGLGAYQILTRQKISSRDGGFSIRSVAQSPVDIHCPRL